LTGHGGRRLGAPLFNLDVALSDGRKGRILVCAGADAREMAREFVAAHALPAALEPKLLAHIEQQCAAQAARRAAREGGEKAAARGEGAAEGVYGAWCNACSDLHQLAAHALSLMRALRRMLRVRERRTARVH